MAGTTGTGPNTHALEIRLSVPAEGGLRGIAGELATKVAEYLGTRAPDAQSLATKVEGLASRVSDRARQQQDITFEFCQVEGELVIKARCSGEASEVRHPLPE